MKTEEDNNKIKGPQLTIETAPEPESASPAEPQKTDEDTPNEAKEQIRTMRFLDGCRHPDYPDDIAVFLLRGDNQPERVWVRGNHLTEHEIRGELLNEPNADFGVHYGDSIQIAPYKQEDGSIICVSHQRE